MQQELKKLKQVTVKGPTGRSPDSQHMSMAEKINEVKDKIELRFDTQEPLPETAEDA